QRSLLHFRQDAEEVHPPRCTKYPSYGVAGIKRREFCFGHAKDGMVDVCSKRCNHRGCTKRPSFIVAGTCNKTAGFCSRHAEDGMVDKKCTHRGCTKCPSYGVAGTKTAELCSGHAKDGMVNVIKKKCTVAAPGGRAMAWQAPRRRNSAQSGHANDGMVDV
ncbi:unnamed protein product, partial [Pylaiella littoralis]